MAKFKVVGPCEINDVAPGGIVSLDPEKVNIDALVLGGHVEPYKGEKPPDRPAKGGRPRKTAVVPPPVVEPPVLAPDAG